MGRAAADMVLSLLVPNSKKRLSAAAALQLPFFLQPDADSVQPSDSVQLLTADAQVCVSKKMFTAGTDTSALPGSLAKPDEKPGVSSAVAPANSPVSLVASAQDSSGMQTILTDSSAPSAKAVLTEQPCMPGQAHSGVQMASDDGNSSCSTPGDAPPPESHSTQVNVQCLHCTRKPTAPLLCASVCSRPACESSHLLCACCCQCIDRCLCYHCC